MIKVKKSDGREWVLSWVDKSVIDLFLEHGLTQDVDGINNVPKNLTLVVPDEQEMGSEGWYKFHPNFVPGSPAGSPAVPATDSKMEALYKLDQEVYRPSYDQIQDTLRKSDPNRTVLVGPVRERLIEEEIELKKLMEGHTGHGCIRAAERGLCLVEELLRAIK